MTPRLIALIKRVAELHWARLEACHYDEEFTIHRIRPLSHWEKLAFECLRLTDLSCNPGTGKALNFLF
jgi:hypothetical protein